MSGGASPAPSRTRLLALLLLFSFMAAAASSARDADTLLGFKATMKDDGGALNDWTSASNNRGPCLGGKAVWTGVRCEDGQVIKLVLESMSLSGTPEVATLASLPELRSLSLMNNSLRGKLPAMGNLAKLRSLFLAYNGFSGDVDDDAFAGLGSLRSVHLEHNQLTGPLPSSLALLPKLNDLHLEDNRFTGALPELPQQGLVLNVSYNLLQGPIPATFLGNSKTCFIGNTDLCGKPLDVPCKKTNNNNNSKKFPTPLLIAIVVVAGALVLAFAGLIIAKRVRRRARGRPSTSKKFAGAADADSSPEQGPAGGSGGKRKVGSGGGRVGEQGSKLVFVREGRERFELQDLLRASAEVLSNGVFGSSYKAMMVNGTTMVVKRFREMNGVGMEEFQEHMRVLGGLSHLNLLPLVAFYYRKEEKLLVTDYVNNGSLAQLLHGNRAGMSRVGLDWATRLKIVKGVGRGLAYLYREMPMLATPHGHLKSSNVLLDDTFEPLLTDYALSPVVNPAHAADVMVSYRSPEYAQRGRTTKKSDVWSLGILILEILTGKVPDNYVRRRRSRSSSTGTSGSNGGDLASWVNSVVREEWTGEVFDGGMGGTKNGEGEMLKLLQIGLACCEPDLGQRWDLAQALESIEELKDRDAPDESVSSYTSEGELHSTSRHITEDDFSFSTNA